MRYAFSRSQSFSTTVMRRFRPAPLRQAITLLEGDQKPDLLLPISACVTICKPD